MTKIAIAQTNPKILNTAENLRVILKMIEDANKNGAELVIFPELALTGCSLTSDEAKNVAERIPGKITNQIIEACKKNKIYAIVTLIECEGDKFYNTAILVSPDGIIGKYRKTHLPCLGVDRYLTAGDDFLLPVQTSLGRLGILICWDVFFPEASRFLALSNAQAIIIPTNWLASNDLTLEFYRIRAVENNLYVFWVNRVGEERGLLFSGRSAIISPNGEILLRASPSEEQLLFMDIDLKNAEQGKLSSDYPMDVLNERRPELYSKLILSNKVE
jgi:predicted amidohydrolase